jgi:hypothetical protein
MLIKQKHFCALGAQHIVFVLDASQHVLLLDCDVSSGELMSVPLGARHIVFASFLAASARCYLIGTWSSGKNEICAVDVQCITFPLGYLAASPSALTLSVSDEQLSVLWALSALYLRWAPDSNCRVPLYRVPASRKLKTIKCRSHARVGCEPSCFGFNGF